FNYIGDLLDTVFTQLTNVHQAVFAGHNLHECAEVEHTDHWHVGIDSADFGVVGDAFNPFDGGFNLGFVRAGNHHRPIVLDINLCAGLGGNPLYHLAAFTDNFADFIRVNRDALDARRVRAEFSFMRLQ